MGRRFFVVAGVLALVMVLAGCDWTFFGFDGGHTRASAETTISAGNVAGLNAAWAGLTGATVTASPAVVHDITYVTATDNKLYAFDGKTNCTPALKTCNPLWTAGVTDGGVLSPAVSDGLVFAASSAKLLAFDASGVKNCSGSPKTCTPVWTATLTNGFTESPSVADSVVYIHSGGTLYTFDAKATSCPGNVCAPLWTGSVPPFTGGAISSPVVADGVVYVPDSSTVYAFDAKAVTGCSGPPKVCVPLWSTSKGGLVAAAVNGRLYALTGSNLFAYDGAGSQSCHGIPKVCDPLWGYATNGQTSAPAIANGVVYIGGPNGGSPRLLAAFDANGSTGCNTATPKVCAPLWTATLTGGNATDSAPAVTNGVVFVGSFDNKVYAFRASADSSCTGTAPKSCPPLWSQATNGFVHSSPAISNGTVYVGSNDKSLYAFK